MKFAALTAAAVAFALAAPATAQFSVAYPLQNWTPAAPTGGWNVNNYQVDDGTTENCLGLTAGGDFVHIQRFSAVGGADTINKVLSAFGCTITPPNSPPPGTAITVFVWEDPNDDGNPVDGVLLSSAPGVIVNTDNDVLDPFTVPPAAVSNVFHVGVRVPQVAGQFPGPMDTSGNTVGQTWVTGNGTANTYTGTPVTGTIGLFDVGAIGFPCNWLLRAEGGTSSTVYCTAKVTSNGCTPAIGDAGAPSASAIAGYVVNATNMINNKSCLLFYGVNTGQAAAPFQGGLLCVKTPIKRTPGTTTGGNPPPNDCSGAPAIDMNCFASGNCGGSPVVGMHTNGNVINCQWWGRDPGFAAPNNTQLSNGLEYTVGP